MAIKIAIIDDDHHILEMYKYKFDKDGFEVRIANTAEDGFKLVKSFLPDLLLIDLLLPHEKGEDLLKRIRLEDWGKDLKVIVLTNTNREEAPGALDALDISRYVIKAEQTVSQLEQIAKEVLGIED